MDGQKYRQRRITCKALILAHDLPCVLYQPHAMGDMELYGGREVIEGLHCGFHSDYIVGRESPFGYLWNSYWIKSSETQLRKLKWNLKDNPLLTKRPPALPSGSNRFKRSLFFRAIAPGSLYIYILFLKIDNCFNDVGSYFEEKKSLKMWIVTEGMWCMCVNHL